MSLFPFKHVITTILGTFLWFSTQQQHTHAFINVLNTHNIIMSNKSIILMEKFNGDCRIFYHIGKGIEKKRDI